MKHGSLQRAGIVIPAISNLEEQINNLEASDAFYGDSRIEVCSTSDDPGRFQVNGKVSTTFIPFDIFKDLTLTAMKLKLAEYQSELETL